MQTLAVLWLPLFGAASTAAPSPGPVPEPRLETQQRRGDGRNPPVFKVRIVPHWFHGNTRLWYRNDLAGAAREFVVVDADAGTRAPAFDHAKLAAALSRATGDAYRADRLPFDRIEFTADQKAVRFKVGETTWQYDSAGDRCEKTEASPALERPARRGRRDSRRFGPRNRRGRRGRREASRRPVPSPDGKHIAVLRDHDIFLRAEGKEEIRLTKDGKEGHGYGQLAWSPDSTRLVAWRTELPERGEVYLIESSPRGGGRARLHPRSYALPGDEFPQHELHLFDVASGTHVRPDVDRFEHERSRPRLHWEKDGRHFAYAQVDRGHQRFRLIEVDAHTGEVRNLIDEKSETFLWTAHTENLGTSRVRWLQNSEEILFASERDGWRHLYLVDVERGNTTRITQGEWVVRAIDHIDEQKRQIWFAASGREPDQDPYFLHHYRIGFDGTGLVALTEGNGNHTVQFSPDRRYLIDTYSRVDMAPVHELRRSSDGALVCKLEEADIDRLVAGGWQPPEVFVAKGRDGKTDIWGILTRPKDLDPSKKYPVIEDIYAGPQGSFVPKSFRARQRYARLADLGFIVVKIDGMGTANRSKAFHDVCWKNLKDAGFPDRIRWMKAAAAKYPYMDLDRVGVYGTSAGGQNAAGAVLFHPEFYRVAVANCGCHDNRMDKASWNEQWMGYPVGPQYAASSNIDNAHRLRGKLFLIVGEMDTNVPPESTLRFVDALIRAGKDFDLLVVPGAGHGARARGVPGYVTRRTHDFFVRHLLGVEPPNRNLAAPSNGR